MCSGARTRRALRNRQYSSKPFNRMYKEKKTNTTATGIFFDKLLLSLICNQPQKNINRTNVPSSFYLQVGNVTVKRITRGFRSENTKVRLLSTLPALPSFLAELQTTSISFILLNCRARNKKNTNSLSAFFESRSTGSD